MTALKAIGAVLALTWSALWYLPAWLAGAAWSALRRGWVDGTGRGYRPEEE